jgi:hypothetical protein
MISKDCFILKYKNKRGHNIPFNKKPCNKSGPHPSYLKTYKNEII